MVSDPRYDAQKAVARANRAFYDAIEALDIGAMRAVWLEASSVRCVHPGWEMLVGSELVMASWSGIFEHTEKISFELLDVAIELLGDSAMVTLVERVSSGEDQPEGQMAATNLFVRADGAWKLVLHHASPIARRVT